jgi:ATP-dependent protease ClpP protease subunit
MARDKFMSSYEAVEYGIIDDVLVNRRRWIYEWFWR